MNKCFENKDPLCQWTAKFTDKPLIENDTVLINSTGEGGIWVCNKNGNLENGDYITTSGTIHGYGVLQDDDILHNYTVAKATEPIDFSTISVDSDLGYKSVLVACTYHCS